MNNYNSYTVRQLKQILKEKTNIRGFSKLRKKEVIAKLKNNNVNYYPPIEKVTYNKRIAIKTYNDEEQEQFLNKGYEVIDPLKSKGEYFNIKSGKNEIVELLNHQEKFLRKFFLSNVTGSIVFHGVGTGKSLTAAAASHYYLSLNPDGHIVFVSPPALITNFINALKQYGLDEKDKRYSFYSFEKFTRNPNIQNKKCLFIVDEAHILRTEINVSEAVNLDGQTVKQVNKNKRGYAVLEGIKKIDKCILLTGTPFINKLYDIENLLSMVTKKDPLDESNFSQMITNTESRHDYFRYRISHYENEVGSIFFPKKIQEYIPLVMDEGELKKYNDFEKGNLDVLEDETLEEVVGFNKIKQKKNNEEDKGISKETFTSFYNGTRQYSNLIAYKKINFIVERIKNVQTTGQFIIYTTFLDNGVKVITQYLNLNNITYAIISGKENSVAKENSKNKYNNKDVQVLIITKAGTEGIDTIGTEGIFIYEGSSWNEPLVEQAIARAVRFKSHFHLPKNHQKVYVYRLLIVKPNDVETINKINNKEIYNFGALLKKYQLISNEIKKRDFQLQEYRALSKEEKEKYLKTVKFEAHAAERAVGDLFKQTPSIEARLTVLSLAKKDQIIQFINELDTQIQQLEDYETPYEKAIVNMDISNMSQKDILNLQKKYINEQKENIMKKINSKQLEQLYEKLEARNNIMDSLIGKAKRNAKLYQEYFTPVEVVKILASYSTKLKSFGHIDILEPTAGCGNIPTYIIKHYNKDYKFYMVELQDKNREVLKELCKGNPDILTLEECKNFLQYVPPRAYDLIIMNPPFHLRKSSFSYLDRDYYDIDFVKKAFYMLKDKGELIALCGRITKKEDIEWITARGEIINTSYKNWQDPTKKTKEERKAAKIAQINLSIVVIYYDPKKEKTKEKNNALDPDLSDKQEQKADDFEKFHTPYKTRRGRSDID